MKSVILCLMLTMSLPCFAWADGRTIVLVEIVRTNAGELAVMLRDYAKVESRESLSFVASAVPHLDWVAGQKYVVWCERSKILLMDGKEGLNLSWFGVDESNKFYSPTKREKITWAEFRDAWRAENTPPEKPAAPNK